MVKLTSKNRDRQEGWISCFCFWCSKECSV